MGRTLPSTLRLAGGCARPPYQLLADQLQDPSLRSLLDVACISELPLIFGLLLISELLLIFELLLWIRLLNLIGTFRIWISRTWIITSLILIFRGLR